MPSIRRIDANQRNAQMSTGPRTQEGKLRSSQNALTHGLTSTRTLLPGEDALEFEEYCNAVINELHPNGRFEIEYADRIAKLSWRLRRADGLEAAFIEWQAHRQAKTLDRVTVLDTLNLLEENDARSLDKIDGADSEEQARLKFGRAVEASLRGLERITSYAGNIQRQRSALLKELFAIQARRHPSASPRVEDGRGANTTA